MEAKDPQHFLFGEARINGHQSLLSASASRLIVSTVFFPTQPFGELFLDTMLIDHGEKIDAQIAKSKGQRLDGRNERIPTVAVRITITAKQRHTT